MEKIINSFLKLGRFLIDIKNRIFATSMSKFRATTVILLVIKTIFFLGLVQEASADKLTYGDISTKFAFIYLAVVLSFYSLGYLFNKNKQIVFHILLNLLYGVLLVSDLWYFRANNYLLGIRNILYKGTFNPLGGALYKLKPIDWIFFIDIIILLVFVIVRKVRCSEYREVSKFTFTLRYSIIMMLISFISLDVFSLGGWDAKILKAGWDVKMTIKGPGVLGYHLVEGVRTTERKLTGVSNKDKVEIDNWIKDNQENLQDNEFKGIAKGKNVIFLQIESLENFVINKTTNGKEITPFLNKLTKRGLYFNNFYEQNYAGNSIDCDFMVNSSVFPLGDRITGLNYGENTYENSLPRILKGQGYKTISSHAEEPGEFNWAELHKNSFGADKIWSIRDYNYDEVVGYGLSDRSLYTQLAEKLKNEKEPFFLQVPTLSSHGPFEIDEKYRELGLPEEVDKSYLGGYFESVHYADKQLEMLFNKLDKEGILKNTMVVIYGDHTGVHKYYNDDIQKLSYEGDWWKKTDFKMPLIIYSQGMPTKLEEAPGGQVDLLPTISYLLGIDSSNYKNTSMGRVLVNTNRTSTVIKGNKLIGNIKSEEEKKHLLDAYKIGKKIIETDYFSSK